MILYDHTSPINWAYRGKMTAKQMAKDPTLAPILTQETVLYDNGEGTVYDWRYLDALKGAYDVEEEDPEAALAEVISRMNVAPVTLTDVTDAVLENTMSISEYEDRVSLIEEAILELSGMEA